MTSRCCRRQSRTKSCAAGIQTLLELSIRRLRSRDCSRKESGKIPKLVAVSFEGEALTYAELNAKANRLAHRLIGAGAQRGVIVGLCLHRSLDLVVALLAIQKSGAAYVPLDPGFPAERLSYMLADSGASLLLAEP